MALTKEQKQKNIDSLKEKISLQKSIIFADFANVKSDDLFELRNKLKEQGCNLKVGKKTLIRIAFGQSNISFWNKIKLAAQGQMALVFGMEDEVAPARIANEFAKTNKEFKILGGIFENRFIEKDKVLQLANLPSRDQLLAKVVGSLASPISGFANVLQGNIKGLINVLDKKSKL